MSARRLDFLELLNVYVVETPAGPVLVDSAAPGLTPWLRRGLARLGLSPGDLAGVVVTHFHLDHVGTARRLAREGVPVYAHRDEIPILTGERPHPGYGPGRRGRALAWLERRLLAPMHFAEVRPLESGEALLGSPWRVVAAPGHTPGSLALHHEESGELLSGDTLVNQLGRPRGPHPVYTADPRRALESALALLELEPTRILPGHGPPVPASDFAEHRRDWGRALGRSVTG